MNTVITIIVLGLVIWLLYSRFAGVKDLKNLTADRFAQELQSNRNRVLIDVREQMEVKQGMIPGAINVPLSQIKGRMADIPRDQSIYLYCRSGMRSKQAAKILRKNGYQELSHLQGGIMSWQGKMTK
ncbi:rhodanese-like domain-containing protein [Paenibacillus sp. MBLB4367]|uniref:rhodanese-like domain-containing protein n=1 Tax=Paenibacillus sp. MBLB4367 TaxID=3384767 RepID=UPI0039082433